MQYKIHAYIRVKMDTVKSVFFICCICLISVCYFFHLCCATIYDGEIKLYKTNKQDTKHLGKTSYLQLKRGLTTYDLFAFLFSFFCFDVNMTKR